MGRNAVRLALLAAGLAVLVWSISCSNPLKDIVEQDVALYKARLNQPTLSVTPNPITGSTLAANQQIVLVFSQSMQTSTVVLTGDLTTTNIAWSKTTLDHDTVALSRPTAAFWPSGTGKTLIVDGTSAAGTVLQTTTITYNVSALPSITAGLQPAGTAITAHETLVITFTDSMDPSSVALTGDLTGGTPAWDRVTFANDRLTLTAPAGFWPAGAAVTLKVNGNNADGYPMTELSVSKEVFKGMCVSIATGNDTSNTGTTALPYKSIQKGIDIASSTYGTAQVRVAGGNYTVSSGTGYVADLASGISLLGGYLCDGVTTNWANRSPSVNVTTMEDARVGGTSRTMENDPYAAVHIPATVTSLAPSLIDGFTIISAKGGGGTAETGAYAGLYCEGAATIQNNTIHGRSAVLEGGKFAIGITVKNSSPLITRNVIDAGPNKGTSSAGNTISYGIYSFTASPIIENNWIVGGTQGFKTFGIFIAVPVTPATIIRNNVIQGGTQSLTSIGIINYNQDTIIYNNTIDGGYGQNGYCIQIQSGHPYIKNNILFYYPNPPQFGGFIISEEAASPTADPTAVDNNAFGPPKDAYYRDNNSTNILNMTPATVSTTAATQTLAFWNNVAAIPVFVNAPTDFHLQASSDTALKTGGIDGAAAGWGFTTDMAGITRTGNGSTGWSMGAYEY
jgi:hypothetical protein